MKLYRYSDPVVGPRTIPPLPPQCLLQLGANDKFSIDVTKGTIALTTDGGALVDIGNKMVYTA